MSKKNKKYYTISAEQVWNVQKPRYNGYAVGHGPHGSVGYNRNKEKRKWTKMLSEE